jgi:hypothetical protein
MPNPGNVGYTKESFPITKYTRDGFISTTAENFTGVKLDDTQTLENIRIDSITTGGKYFGIYTIKPVLEGTSLVNADNRYTEESSSDTERVFIVCHKTSAGDYRMMRLVFSKASSMMLQVKITLVKYVLSSTNPTSLLVTNLWRSGTLFGVEDAPQGVATSDANETKGKGYGIKSLTITFEDPTPKYYYSLTATNSQKAVETVKLEKTGESGTFLVVLRDGQLTEGVAAQKLLTLSSTKNEVKFLQEDIRPYIVYEPSKITVGTTYRFESALGKRFFLKSSGVIAEVPQDTDDISTKFMLGERKALSTSPTPINTITPMNDPTRFMTMQTSAKVSKDITFAAFGAYANVDWSIVPAINGAYAFVSIALANIPGYFLVAEPLTVGTTTTYRAVAKLVDEKDDIAAFYACWRLYPAL